MSTAEGARVSQHAIGTTADQRVVMCCASLATREPRACKGRVRKYMAADVAASTARAGHALARHAQLLSRAACSGGTAAAVAAAAAAAELSACDQTSMERSMDASSDASNHAPFLRGSMHTSLRRPQMIARTFGAVRRV